MNAFLDLAGPYLAKAPSSWSTLGKLGYTVKFGEARAGPPPHRASASKSFAKGAYKPSTDSWTIDDLDAPKAVAPLTKMTPDNRKKVSGTSEALSITTRRGGGSFVSLPFDASSGAINVKSLFTGRGFMPVSGTYTAKGPTTEAGKKVGDITFTFFKNNAHLKEQSPTFSIMSVSGMEYGGMIDTTAVRKLAMELKHASPIEFDDLDLDFSRGLVGRGVVRKPTIKLLERVQIAVLLDGDAVGLEASIAAGDLSLPGPFKVKGGVITLSATTAGFGVSGDIEFEIEKLAKGKIGAGTSTATGGRFLPRRAASTSTPRCSPRPTWACPTPRASGGLPASWRSAPTRSRGSRARRRR